MACIGTGLAGLRQRELIQWYISQQNEKNNYTTMDEAAAEIKKVKAIIEVKITLIFICINPLSRLLSLTPRFGAELDTEGRISISCGRWKTRRGRW